MKNNYIKDNAIYVNSLCRDGYTHFVNVSSSREKSKQTEQSLREQGLHDSWGYVSLEVELDQVPIMLPNSQLKEAPND